MSTKDGSDPQKGDNVSWKWGGGVAHGTVKEVKSEETHITSKGKDIKRKGDEDNPAVVIEGNKNPVLKKASELTMDK